MVGVKEKIWRETKSGETGDHKLGGQLGSGSKNGSCEGGKSCEANVSVSELEEFGRHTPVCFTC